MRTALDALQRRRLLAGILLGLAAASATLAQPLLVGRLIDGLVTGRPVSATITLIATVFALDLALGALSFFLIGRVGEHVVATMRRSFVDRILRAPLARFHQFPQGDLMTRGVADTAIARLALSSSLAQIITSAFTVLGCLAVMAFLDWKLLLATVLVLALASLACLGLARRVHAQAAVNREDTGHFGDELLRVVTNVTTVKSTGNEETEVEALGASADRARLSGIRVIRTSALLLPAMNVGTQLALAVVIAWGMARTLSGELTLAALSTFVMYVLYLVAPLVTLFMGVSEFQQARAAMDRLDEIMSIEPEPSGRQRLEPSGQASVAMERVTFTYPGGGGVPALREASLALPRRGMTAIVGPSGAGKSTLFNLWERFYDADEGTVLVAGTDIRDHPLEQLRTYFGLVEQDSPLMRGTIRSNLLYGAPAATEEDMTAALEKAQLRTTIEALPAGLDTQLGEDGLGLSGGQRQRLAIARTLLRKPQVLLLDEATANLDAESEFALNQAMREAARDTHVVVIAHRMSTARAADSIVVMRDGRIVDDGTHVELYARNATYRKLADNHLRDPLEELSTRDLISETQAVGV